MAQPRYTRKPKESEGSKGKWIVLGVLVLLLLAAGSAWGLGLFSGPSGALTEVQQLQAKLDNPALKEQDRRVLWRELREKTDALSDEDRDVAWEAGRQRFEKRMNQRMKEVLAMSKDDQIKALDADIDRIQRFEQMRQNRDAQGQQAGGQGNNAQNNNRANRPGNGFRSSDDRVTQLKNRMDRSTPEVRTMRYQYRQMIDQRMQQRGLPPMNNRRWG